MSDKCADCGMDFNDFNHVPDDKCYRRTMAELRSQLSEAREALEMSRKWRLAYRDGKFKMFAEGGIVQDAAMRLLPCNEADVNFAEQAALAALSKPEPVTDKALKPCPGKRCEGMKCHGAFHSIDCAPTIPEAKEPK